MDTRQRFLTGNGIHSNGKQWGFSYGGSGGGGGGGGGGGLSSYGIGCSNLARTMGNCLWYRLGQVCLLWRDRCENIVVSRLKFISVFKIKAVY